MEPEPGGLDMVRFLTVGQAAQILGTSECFPRRLIAERRIRFVRVGRRVRIPEDALSEFARDGEVEPIDLSHMADTWWVRRRFGLIRRLASGRFRHPSPTPTAAG